MLCFYKKSGSYMVNVFVWSLFIIVENDVIVCLVFMEFNLQDLGVCIFFKEMNKRRSFLN